MNSFSMPTRPFIIMIKTLKIRIITNPYSNISLFNTIIENFLKIMKVYKRLNESSTFLNYNFIGEHNYE